MDCVLTAVGGVSTQLVRVVCSFGTPMISCYTVDYIFCELDWLAGLRFWGEERQDRVLFHVWHVQDPRQRKDCDHVSRAITQDNSPVQLRDFARDDGRTTDDTECVEHRRSNNSTYSDALIDIDLLTKHMLVYQ